MSDNIIGTIIYKGKTGNGLTNEKEYRVINIVPPKVEIIDDYNNIVLFDMFAPNPFKDPLQYGKWEIKEDITGVLHQEMDIIRIGKLKYIGRSFEELTDGQTYIIKKINRPFFQVVDNTGKTQQYFVNMPSPLLAHFPYGYWEIEEDLYGKLNNELFNNQEYYRLFGGFPEKTYNSQNNVEKKSL